LVLDTETTTDAAQQLLFGSYRVYDGTKLLQEGLIHADDLDTTSLAKVQQYAAENQAASGRRLRVRSRSDFVEAVLWKVGYRGRGLIVGFNLAFDLSRLAVGVGESRRSHRKNGNGREDAAASAATDASGRGSAGFSLLLFQYRDEQGELKEHQFRPRITVKAAGSKRQFLSFTGLARGRTDPENLVEGQTFRGHFLDLHMASFALTDKSLTLEGAARAFGIHETKRQIDRHGVVTAEYIDYNRQDVYLTYLLYEAVAAEWAKHPVDVPLEELYSPASVGKACLAAMGITPPLSRAPDVPPQELGRHMGAYYGGRTEGRIRATPVPIRYVDVTSMYSTVFVSMGLFRYVVAERLEMTDATDDARSFVRDATRAYLLDPRAWLELATVVVRVRPAGELLPSRHRYGIGDGAEALEWTIALNPLTSDVDLWFTLADVVAAKLLGGRAPEILEARRILPVGTQEGLSPVRLRGEVYVDPTSDDFFRSLIEERQRIRNDASRDPVERETLQRLLKTIGSATSYGIFAETRVGDPVRGGVEVVVFGPESMKCRVTTPETAGALAFPPIAATIAGGARLMLALIQGGVEARGGTFMGCDTDSLFIVASPAGGFVPCLGGPHRLADGRKAVRALSDAEVDAVLAEIERLNPYDPTAVPRLVKLEDENFDRHGRRVDLMGYQLGSKRYVLYERTRRGPRIRKFSRHGLGMYRPPHPDRRDRWIRRVWYGFLREAEGLASAPSPDWLQLPAVSQLTASTPHVLRPFGAYNRSRPYEQQVKPFNFLLVGHVDPMAPLPPHLQRPVVPFHPYETAAVTLPHSPRWVDRHSGQSLVTTTRGGGRPGTVRLKTYGDAVADYRWHPEAKNGDPRGGTGRRTSQGLLPRLSIRVTDVRHIGKEGNRLDEEESGALFAVHEPYVEYHDERAEWEAALPTLRRIRERRGVRYLCGVSGLSERAVRYALNGGKVPRREARQKLLRLTESPSD